MEIVFIIIVVVFLLWLLSRKKSDAPPIQPTAQPKPTSTYRPKARTAATSSIKFKPTPAATAQSTADLSGLHDAFTGEPLNPTKGLYQCNSCQVYYHRESYDVIVSENNQCCVACGRQSIRVVDDRTPQRGRDHNPSIVTLDSYRSYFGQVVTFEGVIQDVRESRRGKDFALMFERKDWSKGFKLVFFRGAARKVGVPYVKSLNGRTVKVRGLLVDHPKWGPEIIVSEKSMILEAR